jgi:hypothetical protein
MSFFRTVTVLFPKPRSGPETTIPDPADSFGSLQIRLNTITLCGKESIKRRIYVVLARYRTYQRYLQVRKPKSANISFSISSINSRLCVQPQNTNSTVPYRITYAHRVPDDVEKLRPGVLPTSAGTSQARSGRYVGRGYLSSRLSS